VNVYYLKSNKLDAKGNAQLATNVEDVKFIALNIQNPENIIDDATIETDPLQFIDVDKHNKTIGFLSFLIKKGDIIPNPTTSTNDNKIAWKTGQNGTFYPLMQTATWNALFTSANTDVFDLTQYATGLDTYANLATYKWTISKIANNTTSEADFVQPTLQLTAQNLTSTRTADVSTVAATGGTATTFNVFVDPTVVKYNKNIKITISDYAGVAGLSRTSLTAAPAAGAAHVYQTLTLNFKDIFDYQTYKQTGLTYQDGAVGKAATTLETKAQEFFVQASAPAGLQESWTTATTGGAPATITAAAVKNYVGGANQTLAAILNVSENSAYELFAGAYAANFAWGVNNYVAFAEYDFDGDDAIGTNDYAYYVKSENGAVNEYITPTTLPTATNMATILGAAPTFAATAGAPTLLTKINQTLVIKVVDAFGRTHDFSIPFELIP